MRPRGSLLTCSTNGSQGSTVMGGFALASGSILTGISISSRSSGVSLVWSRVRASGKPWRPWPSRPGADSPRPAPCAAAFHGRCCRWPLPVHERLQHFDGFLQIVAAVGQDAAIELRLVRAAVAQAAPAGAGTGDRPAGSAGADRLPSRWRFRYVPARPRRVAAGSRPVAGLAAVYARYAVSMRPSAKQGRATPQVRYSAAGMARPAQAHPR